MPRPEPAHPLVALWSHPRSMSTATERIMRERGDMTCFHEPFMYYYYVHLRVREMPHFEVDPAQPSAYEDVLDRLFAEAAARPVFFKDMAYYIVDDLPRDSSLATTIRHAFLIRDPRRSILSYHKLDPDVTEPEIGLEAQWHLASWIAETTGRRPPVVEAEAIQRDAQGVIGRLWAALGLEPRPEAFSWSEESTPGEWSRVITWHGEIASSTGIRPPTDEDEAEIEAKFRAAAETTPKLAAFRERHQPFYERLRAWAREGAP